MKDIFGDLTLALGSYRYSIGTIVPGMTRVAWSLKRAELQREIPGITRKKFLYNLSRSSYQKEWGTQYRKPGFGTRLLTILVEVIPKVGPFKALKVKMPTPEVEKMFMASFNASVASCRTLLANVGAGQLDLPNQNIDIGEPTRAGQYKGTDEAYATLLGKLADKQFAGVSPDLRENILAFYKDGNPSLPAKATEKERAELAKLSDQLDRLRAVPEAVPVSQLP
jgi:hypothetical protein